MTPEYTRRGLERAAEEARRLARNSGQNVWTIEHQSKARIWINQIGEEPPNPGEAIRGWRPDGSEIETAQSKKRRNAAQGYDVYRRTEPEPTKIGTIQGKTLAQALNNAADRHGWPVMIAPEGPESAEHVRRQIEREGKCKADAHTKARRRTIKLHKMAERERLQALKKKTPEEPDT